MYQWALDTDSNQIYLGAWSVCFLNTHDLGNSSLDKRTGKIREALVIHNQPYEFATFLTFMTLILLDTTNI